MTDPSQPRKPQLFDIADAALDGAERAVGPSGCCEIALMLLDHPQPTECLASRRCVAVIVIQGVFKP